MSQKWEVLHTQYTLLQISTVLDGDDLHIKQQNVMIARLDTDIQMFDCDNYLLYRNTRH